MLFPIFVIISQKVFSNTAATRNKCCSDKCRLAILLFLAVLVSIIYTMYKSPKNILAHL